MFDSVPNVDLSEKSYVLEKGWLRNAYNLYDVNGNQILEAKWSVLEPSEPQFRDAQGNEVLRAESKNPAELRPDCDLFDCRSGSKLAVLGNDTHSWEIKSADNRTLATVEDPQTRVQAIRRFLRYSIGPFGLLNSLLSVLPRKYTIENAEGDQIGSLRKGFSLRTRYDIELDLDAYGRELILASVVATRYKALV